MIYKIKHELLKLIYYLEDDIGFGFIPKYHTLNIPIIDKMIFCFQCFVEDRLFDVTSKYHMLRMPVDNNLLHCDIWLYYIECNIGIRENELPRILIRDREKRYKPIRVEITPEARIIFPNKKKAYKVFKHIDKIQEFVKENYEILLLHWEADWEGDWDECTALVYYKFILKMEMTQKEALCKLVSDNCINEIPKCYKHL